MKQDDDESSKCFEHFCIKMNSSFPLSSVLFNEEIHLKYQLVFRRVFSIFFLKALLTLPRNLPSAASLLRAKMVFFLDVFRFYMTIEVLEQEWNQFSLDLLSIKSTNSFFYLHKTLFNNLMKQMLLTNVSLIQSFSALTTAIERFCNSCECSNFALIADEERLFDKAMNVFIECLNFWSGTENGNKVLHMAKKLNYNDYYSEV
eukprot:GHVN01088412.1.p1 GENE.GHVN01088412.1~~GHVN01088412.1.p1  ORF type:complete len:203 (-),score=9.84 GHVN01088412.1:15-623(-)